MEPRSLVPLAPLTTLGLGGDAEFFAEAVDEASIVEAVRWAKDRGVPLSVLGGGSNLVVGDDTIPGLVLAVRTRDGVLRVVDRLPGRGPGLDTFEEFASRAPEGDTFLVRPWAGSGVTGRSEHVSRPFFEHATAQLTDTWDRAGQYGVKVRRTWLLG